MITLDIHDMRSESPKEYKRLFQNILRGAYELDQIRGKFESLQENEEEAKESEQLVGRAHEIFQSQKLHIQEMIQRIDTIISERQRTKSEWPTMATIRSELVNYQAKDLPQVSPPYPSLCGAIPLKSGELLPMNTFVCARNGADYILAYVLWYNDETGEYHLCDPDTDGDDLVEFSVPSNEVIPLPSTLPVRKAKTTVHAANSKVLALWPNDNGTWTSVFYPAIVIAPPESSPGLYRLQFEPSDEDVPSYAQVPERYVVKAPG